MAANTSPIFALTPNMGAKNALLSTAMTNTKAFDGTEAAGTAMVLAYTAGASGGKVDSVTLRFTSTNGATASGTTTATVARLWANDSVSGVNTTAGNNIYLGEISIGAATVTALSTGAINTIAGQFTNIPTLPASYKLYVGITVAVGGTACALSVQASGGDY